MKTKIVYTIISTEADIYLEQLMISVYSLLRNNSAVNVFIVTNRETFDSLTGWRASIKKMVSDIIVVDIPEGYNKMQCSRYLKTNLRKFIQGDYLFIDTDTIICGSLASIDDINVDIALCADCNAELLLNDVRTIERCKEAGFNQMGGVPYFNSGVMYVRESKISHDFYKEWYESWKFSSTNGIYLDQPSMNYVNNKMGQCIKELSGRWNCQIFFQGWNCLYQANIIHYAGGGKKDSLQRLYQKVRKEGVDNVEIRALISDPKIKFYAYLTQQLDNRKSMLLLWCYVKCHWLYKLLFREYGK